MAIRSHIQARPDDADIARAQAPQAGATRDNPHEKRSFGSFKFDWMRALAADPNLDTRAKMIGNCILSHINQHSGAAILSDRAISDETAIPLRWITRGRNDLRDGGWIDWKRTGGANVYRVLDDHIPAMKQRLATLKAERGAASEAQKTKAARSATGGGSEPARRPATCGGTDRRSNGSVPPKSGWRSATGGGSVQPQVADKHLRVTPTLTPKERGALSRRSDAKSIAPSSETLPNNWQPSSADRAFARSREWTEARIDYVALKFRVYYQTRPIGSSGVSAAWQLWVLREKDDPKDEKPLVIV
jgi:hypothetical protein